MVPDKEQTLDLPGKDFTSTVSNTFKGLEKTGRRTYEQMENSIEIKIMKRIQTNSEAEKCNNENEKTHWKALTTDKHAEEHALGSGS